MALIKSESQEFSKGCVLRRNRDAQRVVFCVVLKTSPPQMFRENPDPWPGFLYQIHTEVHLGFVTYHLTSEEPGDDGTGDMIVARPYALAQNRTARPLGGTTTIDCGTLSCGATTDWSKVNCTHITETNDTRFLTIAHRRDRRVARSAAISRAGPRRNGRGEPVESRPAVPASRVA